MLEPRLRDNAGVELAARAGREARAVKRVIKRVEVCIVLKCKLVLDD